MGVRLNLEGKVFGKLTVVGASQIVNNKKQHNVAWPCVCVCGTELLVVTNSLSSGHTKSCGCLRPQIMNKHGDRHSKEYRAWQNMKSRCHNQALPSYANYGARGIKVCAQWENSYECFLSDMGRAPTKAHSIDRINVLGDYCPDNCKWATIVEQSINKRKSVLVTWQGLTKNASIWADELGIQRDTFYYNIKKGRTIGEIIERASNRKTATDAGQPLVEPGYAPPVPMPQPYNPNAAGAQPTDENCG